MTTTTTTTTIKLSTLAKLPRGATILGTETILNPFAFEPSDPEVVETFVVLWTEDRSGVRKANFSLDGDYLGDII